MEKTTNHYQITAIDPQTNTVRVTFVYKDHTLDHAISEIGEEKEVEVQVPKELEVDVPGETKIVMVPKTEKVVVFRKIDLSNPQEVTSVIDQHYQDFKDSWDKLDNTPSVPDQIQSLIGIKQEK